MRTTRFFGKGASRVSIAFAAVSNEDDGGDKLNVFDVACLKLEESAVADVDEALLQGSDRVALKAAKSAYDVLVLGVSGGVLLDTLSEP